MNQVKVVGMVNGPKESFELVRVPMYQDEICDHNSIRKQLGS